MAKKKLPDWWARVRAHKPILSAKECDEMEKTMNEFRKEYGWRDEKLRAYWFKSTKKSKKTGEKEHPRS